MATQAGLDRVAQINQTIATQGQAAPNPTAGKNAVTASSSGANPHDLPSYNPANDPTTNVFDPKAPTPNIQPTENANGLPNIDTSQPNPKTVDATKFTSPNIQATPEQTTAVANATKQVQSLSAQVADRQKQGLANVKSTGVAPANTLGQAATVIQNNLPTGSQPQPSVDNFLNPQVNPSIDEQRKQLLDYLSPESDRKMLNDHITQLATDRKELSGMKTELMNMKRVMAGTESELRDEITKAGGFATESQVQALTIVRNKSLVQKAQLISDQIQSQTDLVNSDVSLVGDEKQLAATQFTQRMSLLNYQQENIKNSQDAARSAYTSYADKVGYAPLYQSLMQQGGTAQVNQAEQVMGLPAGSIAQAAAQPDLARQKTKLEIQKLQTEISNANAVDAKVSPDTLQGMLNVYKSTGVIPTFGNSAKSPLRAQFYAALGGADGNQVVTDANTNKTVRAGLNTAYKTQQNLLAANQTAIGALDQQLKLVQQYSDQVGRTNSPLINKYLLGVKSGAFGDPDAAALNNIVKTASYEFAKILSGSAASIGGVTVSSAADAESMLNSAMSKGQFTKVIGLMQQESQFRLKSQKETLANLENDLNNVNSITASVKPIAPVDIPTGYYQASDGLLYKK